MGISWLDAESRRRQDELIPRLCHESGRWLMVRREGDRYIVQARDHRAVHEISVRDNGNTYTVLFQGWFPVRFSLDNPPSGLFARLLLRNMELHFSAWAIAIGGSCEACPTVAALVPRRSLDAALFNTVCHEIRDELIAFHNELHAKFRYDAPPYSPAPPVGGGGGSGQAEVRFIEPEPSTALPAAAEAWRMIQGHAGSVRYRLPKPGE